MPLSRQQADQLIAAGTVPLPPYFPEPGVLTRVTRAHAAGLVVSVELRNSYAQVTRYFVQVDEVRAVLNTKARSHDPELEEWYYGDEAKDYLKKLPEDEPEKKPTGRAAEIKTEYGIVFVRESAGVLVQVDRAVSAGEVSVMRGPCEMRDGCEG
jgi:hypothetical protein